MQQVTSWVADGAAWLVGEAGKLIDATTAPVLSAPWFTGQYRTLAALVGMGACGRCEGRYARWREGLAAGA